MVFLSIPEPLELGIIYKKLIDKEVEIKELFKQYGMDSMSQKKAWIDLLLLISQSDSDE